MESTYNWYWLVDGLMESGYQVHLASTAAIVQDAEMSAFHVTVEVFMGTEASKEINRTASSAE